MFAMICVHVVWVYIELKGGLMVGTVGKGIHNFTRRAGVIN